MKNFSTYIKILRIDHWFKNILVFFGVIIAINFKSNYQFIIENFYIVIAGIFSTCLIASSNYIINEYLDRDFDKHHPEKNKRPGAKGFLRSDVVYLMYICFLAAGLIIAKYINNYFFLTQLLFLVAGFTYNVKPFRFKDIVVIDIISESINAPIRFLLGWFLIFEVTLPPISIVIAFWACGAFLMTVKRLGELKKLKLKKINVIKYRKSLSIYTEEKLILLSLFFSNITALFSGIFLIKHKIELLLCLPFLALFFVYHLKIGLIANKLSMESEKIFKNKKLNVIFFILILTFVISYSVELDFLNYFLIPFNR